MVLDEAYRGKLLGFTLAEDKKGKGGEVVRDKG
jgi:hypothetical protein